MSALSLAAANLTPPPPPPQVEPTVEPRWQGPRVLLYTAPLRLITGTLNAELELQLDQSASVFGSGGMGGLGWDWQAGGRWYLQPVEFGLGPWQVFFDGHLSQHYANLLYQGNGLGVGAAAGARIVAPQRLALSLGLGADVAATSAGPILLPGLRVSVGWGF
ncbi:MAG TPA: hypothetical protein VFA20_03545 [Myxococcaceae bacterium]|nr:hypothetical protein [Myxococcaceae bacterium]